MRGLFSKKTIKAFIKCQNKRFIIFYKITFYQRRRFIHRIYCRRIAFSGRSTQ